MNHHLTVIAQEEGESLTVYLCPANYATVGSGHVVLDPHNGKMLYGKSGLAKALEIYPRGITKDQSAELLATDVAIYAAAVDRLAAKLTANQRSAFISLAFNIGTGAFSTSSAADMAIRGKHHAVPDCIRKWCKARKSANGPLEKVKGLIIRREIEARLYATPDDALFDPLAIRKEMEALWRDR